MPICHYARKQGYIKLRPKCFDWVMCHLKWTRITCVLFFLSVKTAKAPPGCPRRSDAPAAPVSTLITLRQRSRENWLDQSVLSSTEVWIQQSNVTKQNVPEEKKKPMRNVVVFFFFLTESLLCNLKHVGKHVLIIRWIPAVWGFIAFSDTTCFKVFLFKHKSFYIFPSQQKQRWLLHWNMSRRCQRSLWVW